ncbi:MAG TPA: hypothetical protein VJW20_08255 [Candidatus Angelobacter sp.]|nr:hypothetical protein [Candidatus Angelobacter sp.]
MPESARCFERFIPTAFLSGFILMACGLVAGCGGSSTPAPPIPIAAMNGNFSIAATSAGTLGINTFGGGVQTDSAGHVAGIVHVEGSLLLCFGVQLDLPLTGTIDANGHLNATITGSNNQSIALIATVSPNGALLTDGSYSGSGTGCASGDHGTLTGFQVQAFTGTYSGSFSPSPSTNIGLSLVLTQSTTADSHGRFPFSSSTITVAGGSACGFASATLVPDVSVASGNDLNLLLMGSDGVSTMLFVGITLDGNTNLVRGQVFIDTGPCSGQGGGVNLSRS